MKTKTTEFKERVKLEGNPLAQGQFNPYLLLTALAVIVFIGYGNSLTNEFVFDDHSLIYQGKVNNFNEFLQRLTSSYRPLRTVSYSLDFAIWGENPFGFHLTNVLIHLANTIMVFVLARTITSRLRMAFVAALVFAVHPIQTDAVTYISGRRDVLFTLFYLISFYAYLKYKRDGKLSYGFAFPIFWGLSLATKEMAASLPLVIFLWNYCELYEKAEGSRYSTVVQTLKRTLRRDRWLYLSLLIAAIGYIYFMVFVQTSSGRVQAGEINFWGGSLFATIQTSIRIHTWYLKQLVFPTPIAQYLGAFEPSTTAFEVRFILSAIVITVVLSAGLLAIRRHRIIGFTILSYFAMLAPVSQIIPHHELLADHYLYSPMVCFALFVAYLFDMWIGHRYDLAKASYVVLATVILVLMVLTIRRNRDWENDLTLWQATYRSVPQSPRAAYNLGGLLQRTNPQRAEQLLQQSITTDPDFEFGYLALARLYLNQKRAVEAEETAIRGIELLDSGRGSFISRNRPLLKSQLTVVLAGVEWEKGNPRKAETIMLEAIKIYPVGDEAYLGLANFYRAADRLKEQEILRQGAANTPRNFVLLARLASVSLELGRVDESLQSLKQLSGLDPRGNECARATPFLQAMKNTATKTSAQDSLLQAIQGVEVLCRRR